MDAIALDSSSTDRHGSVFHGITGSLPSPSTTLKKGPYDVFINHHGKDVKTTLASYIYHFLDGHGVKVFLDQEELVLGDSFPQEIEDAMRSAPIHIAIFSRNYAASPWCLEELSLMLEIRATIIPVFYDVQPADLRWVDSQETYGQAFQDYKAKGRHLAYLEKWKEALRRASLITGRILNNNNGDVGLLSKRITDRVQQEIINVKVPNEVATYPVGLDDAVKEFEDVIGRENAQIVGIVGISGCGKTTLAGELYNRKCKAFKNCSFLREVNGTPLRKLQKKLLRDLLPSLHFTLLQSKDAIELKYILTGRFKSLSAPVLIVLDDVGHVNQLNALLPEMGRTLGSGSLIIVTTRDMNVLTSWGISSFYKMKNLDLHHATKLFCLHAEPSPPDDFEVLVEKFVNACDGLPLMLKVIGEMLKGKPKKDWEYNLKQISELPEDVEKRLKLSYDALKKQDRDIFLDVACFFVGEKKNLVIAVWDAAGWRGLENLVNKCLVEVDKKNRIRMHNYLRDLGRNIAIECPPHRLWSAEQISKITRSMTSIQETTLIRGIMAATTQFVACSAHDELPECCGHYLPPLEKWMDFRFLELLVVNGEDFTSPGFANLSKQLLWLRLFDFQDKDLPACLSVANLRVLELYGASGLQLWENNAHPPEGLRELNITANKGNIFNSFPIKISGLKQLTKIALISEHGEEFCFKELPNEFCNLRSLEHLELRHCKKLLSLPDCFRDLKKLRHLDLCSCEKLRKLPESFKELVGLEYLDLSGCRNLVPERNILEKIKTLKNLYLPGCSIKWRELPQHVEDQKSLRELHLQNTMLRKLPDGISKLSQLETLRIGSPHFRDLPASLGNLSSLTNQLQDAPIWNSCLRP